MVGLLLLLNLLLIVLNSLLGSGIGNLSVSGLPGREISSGINSGGLNDMRIR